MICLDLNTLKKDFDCILDKVKVLDKNGIIFATLYLKEKQDYKEYIDSINKKLPKFSQIQDYEVLIDNIEVRFK